MSAPNKSYDPVEVSVLSDDAVAAAQAAALARSPMLPISTP